MDIKKPKKSHILIVFIILSMVFGSGMLYGRYRQDQDQATATLLTLIDEEPTIAEEISQLPQMHEIQVSELPPNIFVHVKGAVENPGIYELPPGSRVADALEKAVLLPEANTDIINIALLLYDSSEVVVPFHIKGEKTDWEALALNSNAQTQAANEAAQPTDTTINGTQSSLININSASLTELQTLSGIGPAKAQAIITYREKNGPFGKIDDIKKVSGIGPASFENIKDHISVE